MAITRSNAFPGTVFNPHLQRPSAVSPTRPSALSGMRGGMRGFVAAPNLTYPNGEPLRANPARRGLGNITAAPNLQQFPNGQPMSNPTGLTLVHKQSLVKTALKRHMHHTHKKCGMGDASFDPSISFQPTDIAPTDTSGVYGTPPGVQMPSFVLPTYSQPVLDTSSGPMNTIAGGYQAATTNPITSAISSLANALTGRVATPQYGASGLAYNLGQGLNNPIYSGSSITNGGVMVAGGLLLFLLIFVKSKK